MANEIKEKFSASTALTITLASLASSTSGAGRQSDIVDNSTTRYRRITIYAKLKQGTSPTSGRNAYFFLLRHDADGTPHISDGAGASDAALTVLNAQFIGAVRNKDSGAATGDNVYGEFVIENPGPKWGIAVYHDTGVNLDSTGSNSWIRWVGSNPEVQ